MTNTSETTLDTNLASGHYDHLIDEGFTPDMIWQMEQGGVTSISRMQALKKGYKLWNINKYVSSSGLEFPFTKTFGQVRCDQPIERGGRKVKYITPAGAKTEAALPVGCIAITEGAKDGWRASLAGAPTGFVAGVSHIAKAIPPGGKQVILFDNDGWVNPQVCHQLLNASRHTEGKIQLIPDIEGEPKAGICEYFKAGNTADDYKELVANALWPDEFLYEWIKRWSDYPPRLRARCAKSAAAQTLLMGAVA